MHLFRKKWFIFTLFLCVAPSAFSQSKDLFTIRGEIENPLTSTIHFAGIIRCNAVNGCAKFMLHKDFADYSKNNRDILVTDEKHTFSLSNIEINKDKIMFFFFDSLGREAQIIVSKADAKNGVINVGKIQLQKTYLVQAQINFPDFLTQKNRQALQITFSYLHEGGMFLVGSTRLNEAKRMNIRLLPGKYTVFFDAPDNEGNWRRVIKNIEVEDNDVSIGLVTIATALDNMVADHKTYEEIFTDYDFKQLDSNEIGKVSEIGNTEITLVYFFAGYCGPCLGKDGVGKYFKLAHELKGKLGVIAIHSDSYRMTKNCPTSQSEVVDFLNNKPGWKNIQTNYDPTSPITFLSWQPAEFAERLDINAYPTTMIFKDGVLKKWFVGSNPAVETTIREYLK